MGTSQNYKFSEDLKLSKNWLWVIPAGDKDMKSDLFPILEVIILNISEGATYYTSSPEMKFFIQVAYWKRNDIETQGIY